MSMLKNGKDWYAGLSQAEKLLFKISKDMELMSQHQLEMLEVMKVMAGVDPSQSLDPSTAPPTQNSSQQVNQSQDAWQGKDGKRLKRA